MATLRPPIRNFAISEVILAWLVKLVSSTSHLSQKAAKRWGTRLKANGGREAADEKIRLAKYC